MKAPIFTLGAFCTFVYICFAKLLQVDPYPDAFFILGVVCGLEVAHLLYLKRLQRLYDEKMKQYWSDRWARWNELIGERDGIQF